MSLTGSKEQMIGSFEIEVCNGHTVRVFRTKAKGIYIQLQCSTSVLADLSHIDFSRDMSFSLTKRHC